MEKAPTTSSKVSWLTLSSRNAAGPPYNTAGMTKHVVDAHAHHWQ